MPKDITIVRGITCGRKHKIGRWIKYMPSLTYCSMPTNDDISICSTSDTGKNCHSVNSVALVHAASAVSEVSKGCSDVSKVSGGSGSVSGRV